MTTEEAIDIARRCALATNETHGYLPTTIGEANEWMPHAWVVRAIMEAARHAPPKLPPRSAFDTLPDDYECPH